MYALLTEFGYSLWNGPRPVCVRHDRQRL